MPRGEHSWRSVVPAPEEQQQAENNPHDNIMGGPEYLSVLPDPPKSPRRRAREARNGGHRAAVDAACHMASESQWDYKPKQKFVTLDFTDASQVAVGPIISRPVSVYGSGDLTKMRSVSTGQQDVRDLRHFYELEVRSRGGLCSHFASKGNDLLVKRMEEKFARRKYEHFRSAFIQVSFLMFFCSVVMAVFEATKSDHLIRAILLASVVGPLYLVYGFLAWKTKGFNHTSGTTLEKLILGLLCLHSLVIVLAEWVRPRIDYGMLVMHVGFVQNFSPLGEVAAHMVSTVFCLVPYVFILWLRWKEPQFGLKVGAMEGELWCGRETGDAEVYLHMLMPCIILLSQFVSTCMRDWSMRRDLLSSEQLEAQKKVLKIEKRRCEDLLTSMLPRQIIASLQRGEHLGPQFFPETTVIFVEICDFNRLCAQLQPNVVVEVLNIIYHEFDRISDMLYVYKVETVSQVYMAVVGCPELIVNHADVAAHFALAAQTSMTHLRERIKEIGSSSRPVSVALSGRIPTARCVGSISSDPLQGLTNSASFVGNGVDPDLINIRVGLNSGKVRAGVVGLASPRFKLVGDVVNTASRMESTCLPGRIQVSPTTKERLSVDMFVLEPRPEIFVKGKGMMKTCFLNGYSPQPDVEESKESSARRVVIEYGMPAAPTPEIKWQAANSSGWEQALSAGNTSQGNENKQWVGTLRATFTCLDFTLDNPEYAPQLANHGLELLKQRAAIWRRPSNWLSNWIQQLDRLLLLVPPEKKEAVRMQNLHEDKLRYLDCMLPKWISKGNSLTVAWLLVINFAAAIDFWLQVVEDDGRKYRQIILVRAMGNNFAGLTYLLLMKFLSTAWDGGEHDVEEGAAIGKGVRLQRYAQLLTLVMLLFQGAALLVCSTLLYNSEPTTIAVFGVYVLFYSVCSIRQRLTICAMAVLGYVAIELVQCNKGDLNIFLSNVGFFCVFFAFMACGVRLQEHLEHVSNYDQGVVEKQLQEIEVAQLASTKLLTSLLPAHVVKQVWEGISPIAEPCDDVSVLFTDIKGFTAYSSKITPQELFDTLNSMYSAFDEIIVSWELHKVEIIGDAYCISAGCPPVQPLEDQEPTCPEEYAMRAVEVALAMLRALRTVCDDTSVEMRVGIHTGSVLAGVVGKKGPRYHLFGWTVGYAEQMESLGRPGRVHISRDTHALLQKGGYDYEFEQLFIEVPGDSEKHTTYLVNKSKDRSAIQIQKQLMQRRRHATASRPSRSSRRPVSEYALGLPVTSRSSLGARNSPQRMLSHHL